MFFVYILQSESDRGFYVGLTHDMDQRLKYHNSGRVKSTKHRRPFRVLWKEPHKTRIEAREREKYLKSYKGCKEKMEIIESIIGPIV